MRNIRNCFIILATVILGVYSVYAQVDIPADLQQKLVGKTTLKAIMNEVDSHYQSTNANARKGSNDEEFEGPELKWKRWEHYMQDRLGPNGEFINFAAKNLEALQTNQKNEAKSRISSSTTAVWSFLGPNSLFYLGSEGRGLGRVDCITFHPTDPNIIFVGTPSGGVWKSNSGGSSWYCMTNSLPTTGIAGIAVGNNDPNVIYILTGDANGYASFYDEYDRKSIGVWKSTDGGINWIKTTDFPNTVPGGYNANKIIIHPNDDNILYVSANNMIYKTIDGGNTWSSVFSFNKRINDLEFKPGTPSTVYASMSENFSISTDGGGAWSNTSFLGNNDLSSTNRVEIAVAPSNPNYVYLLAGPVTGDGQFKGVFKSVDSGVSFNRLLNTPNILGFEPNGSGFGDQSNYDLAIACSPTDANVFVTGGLTVWRSTNGGNTIQNSTVYYERYGMSKYIHPDVHYLAFNPLNGYLYAVSDGGFYRSTDNGVSWSDLSDGIGVAMFYSLAGFNGDSNKLLGGTQDNGNKLKTDAGPFKFILGSDGFDGVFDPNDASKCYVTNSFSTVRFNNNGVTQTDINPLGIDGKTGFFAVIDADPVTSGTIYVAYSQGLFKSVNSGTTWVQKGAGVVRGHRAITTCPDNANRIYLTDGDRIWRSNNGGDNWSTDLSLNAGFDYTSYAISDIKVCPTNSNLVWITVGGYTMGKKVYYSTDAGANWQNASGTLPNIPVHSVAIDNNNNVYIGTEIGVFYQSNLNSDWTPYYNSLPKIPISELVINQSAGKIRAATYGRGVWETDLFTTCDPNLSLQGSVSGNQFYQVSNTINSSVNVTGGNATDVFFKAGSEIVLSDGFSVEPNNKFNAIIASCDTPPVPTSNARFSESKVPDFTTITLPSTKLTNHPFGTVRLNPVINNGEINAAIEVFEKGSFMLIISDLNGNEIKKVLPETLFEVGINKVNFNLLDLTTQSYYIQLYFNNTLVHYQKFDI